MGHDHVHLAAVVSGNGTINHANNHVGHNGNEGDEQRNSRALKQSGQNISTQVVRAEPVVFTFRHTAVGIVVHLHVYHSNALGIIFVDNFKDAAFRETACVFQRRFLAVGQHHGAIRNAKLLQQRNFRRQILLANILLGIGIACNVRHNNSQRNDNQNNGQRNHGQFALPQPLPSVFVKADGFCFELLIMELNLTEGRKVLLRDVGQLFREMIAVFNNHYLPPPTRIRGSIMP